MEKSNDIGPEHTKKRLSGNDLHSVNSSLNKVWAKTLEKCGALTHYARKYRCGPRLLRNVDLWLTLQENMFWFGWFLFYSPSTQFRSFRARSVNLARLFLGKLLGGLPVLSAHSFASNWQMLFLNQRRRENGRRNVFITKSPWKNVPNVGIELGAACMPTELASDQATAPG